MEMKKERELELLLTKFIMLLAKRLPDDVYEKLVELREKESNPLARSIYDTMFENLALAQKLDRPACQDTGVIQYFVRVGTKFPYIDSLGEALRNAVEQATRQAPLRHNAVETFDEYNTGCNLGNRVPWIDWEVIPNSQELSLDAYMAGGGCTLPGSAKVLMPSAGYEGLVDFVMDVMVSYGVNACPPLLVGVGVAASVDSAAILSKKALMRRVGSHNQNPKIAKVEALLEQGINQVGLGPQGLSGDYSVLGVNIENAARHPSTIGVAVNVGCWAHRRGTIRFDSELHYKIDTHKGVSL